MMHSAVSTVSHFVRDSDDACAAYGSGRVRDMRTDRYSKYMLSMFISCAHEHLSHIENTQGWTSYFFIFWTQNSFSRASQERRAESQFQGTCTEFGGPTCGSVHIRKTCTCCVKKS